MGVGGSKGTIVSLDEARKRVGDQEWERWGRGFDRIAGRGGRIDIDTFQEAVLGLNIPFEISDRVFEVFTNVKKATVLSKNDFLAGMCIFAAGTEEERLKLLFRVYDLDDNGYIDRAELKRFLTVLRSTLNRRLRTLHITDMLNDVLDEADNDRDRRLSWKEFKKWAQSSKTKGFITWIFDMRPKASQERNEESLDKSLSVAHVRGAVHENGSSLWTAPRINVAGAQHFSEREVNDLEQQFHRLRLDAMAADTSGDASAVLAHGVHKDTLSALFSPKMPAGLLERLFSPVTVAAFWRDPSKRPDTQQDAVEKSEKQQVAAAENGDKAKASTQESGAVQNAAQSAGTRLTDGVIDVHGFIGGLSTCVRGSEEDRLRYFVCAFDDNDDGSLNEVEFGQLLWTVWSLPQVKEEVLSWMGPESTQESKGSSASDTEDVDKTTVTNAAAAVFKRFAPGGELSVADFGAWAREVPSVLSFFPHFQRFASTKLGLRPSSKHEERAFLQSVARQHDEPSVGKTYYVMSARWLEQWARYVGIEVDGTQEFQSLHTGKRLLTGTETGAAAEPVKAQGPTVSVKVVPPGDATAEDTKATSAVVGVGVSRKSVGTAEIDTPQVDDSTHRNEESAKEEKTTGSGVWTNPGPIDNSSIVEPGTALLRSHLLQGEDFVIVTASVWAPLVGWYGGGPALPRSIIRAGFVDASASSTPTPTATQTETKGDVQNADDEDDELKQSPKEVGQLVLEIQPLVLHCYTVKPQREATVVFSRAGTVGEFKEKACTQLGLNAAQARLWDGLGEPRLLEGTDTLEDSQVVANSKIYVEVQSEDGRWSGFPGLKREDKDDEVGESSEKKKGKDKGSDADLYKNEGLCGLYNMGNTCFFNASLQAMSHCRPLTAYYLSDLWARELNETNPLGMQGKVAQQYAVTIKKIWRARPYTAVVPRGLKWAVGKFAPRFVGYQQQDAQELLTFLLDGLHEGLNRIVEKPYIPNPDSNGRPDAVVAKEYWEIYQKRNQSVIVDLFGGLLRSCVSWNGCGHESVVFDPYFCMSLPLPPLKQRYVEVELVYHDPARAPMRFSLALTPNGRFSELQRALAIVSGLPANTLYFANIYNSVVRAFPLGAMFVQELRAADTIIAYEVPPLVKQKDAKQRPAPPPMPTISPPFTFKAGSLWDVKDTYNKWLKATAEKVYMFDYGDVELEDVDALETHLTDSEAKQEQKAPASVKADDSRSVPLPGSVNQDGSGTAEQDTAVVRRGSDEARPTKPSDVVVHVDKENSKGNNGDSNKAVVSPEKQKVQVEVAEEQTRLSPKQQWLARRKVMQLQIDLRVKRREAAGKRKRGNLPSDFVKQDDELLDYVQEGTLLPTPLSALIRAYCRSAGLVFFHYNGYKPKWDEWIDVDEYDRVAPFRTHTVAEPVGAGGSWNQSPFESLALPRGYICLQAVHRVLMPVEDYILHPEKTQPFGKPMLLFVDPKHTTFADLYAIVWRRVRRYARVPEQFAEQMALWEEQHKADMKEDEDSELEWERKRAEAEAEAEEKAQAKQEVEAAKKTTSTDAKSDPKRKVSNSKEKITSVEMSKRDAEVAAREARRRERTIERRKKRLMPPFLLKRVNRPATACSICSWLSMCNGHVIDFSDEVVGADRDWGLQHDEVIAIEWDPVFKADPKLFVEREMQAVWNHPSVQEHRKVQSRAISFQDCMDQFTEEEVLSGDAAPYCSKCKEHHQASKSLSLWSTPPVFVVHLKRLLANRKLFSLVDCPIVGFDPASYIQKARAGNKPRSVDEEEEESKRSGGSSKADEKTDHEQTGGVYDLLAVVNHLGASGAGHYVTIARVDHPPRDEPKLKRRPSFSSLQARKDSSLESSHGRRWFLFDDSRVTEVEEARVITNNAYMLFYMRRGTNSDYLSLADPATREALSAELTPQQRKVLSMDGEAGKCAPCAIQ